MSAMRVILGGRVRAVLTVSGVLLCQVAGTVSAQPPISDPEMRAPVGATPGAFPLKVTATNMDVAVFPGSDFTGANRNNLRVTFPAGGPIRWTESRHNAGDIATLIGPFDPNDPSYFPPNTFVDNYQPLQSGQPFANTTLAWRVNRDAGALFASVRHNGVNNGDTVQGVPVGITHGIAYYNSGFGQGWGYRMNDGEFRNGGVGSADLQTGFAGFDGGVGEASFNTASAFFSYAEGWQGAWVNSGTTGQGTFGHAASGLQESTVQWTNGIANVTLPGVNSFNDGMLFVAPSDSNNNTDIAAAHPVNGGWNVTIREDDNSDFTGATYNASGNNPFQFLYVPYDAKNLVGGEVDGATGTVVNGASQSRFSVSRTPTGGEYAVSIFAADGTTRLTENDGMLVLSVAGALPGDPNLGDRKFLSYQFDPNTGDFIIQSRELIAINSPGSLNAFGDEFGLRDVDFYFAFVDFRNPLSLSLACDFNGDGACNLTDIDLLTMEIASGGTNASFDLNGDGTLNLVDVTQWLSEAGAENLGTGRTYLFGDANLDGVVDGSDFGIWNSNKFTSTGKWSQADLNADGVSDGSDFGVWNSNKFSSSDAATAAVPEPAGIAFAVMVGWVAHRSLSRRRK